MIPIVMTAYNRLNTLRKTLDSLFECDGIEKYRIIIYSDGGKDEKDWDKVYAVRGFLREQDLFVTHWNKNLGLRMNSLEAIRCALGDKIIFIQDDMQFSKDFLKYMDWALNEFEDRKDIMFVSGYSQIYYPTCYLSPLIADGLGIWKDKFAIPNVPKLNYYNYYYRQFAKHTVPLFASNLRKIVEGKSDAFMALLCYQMYLNNARCLHPNGNKIRYMVSNSTNSRKRDTKKLNENLLYTGYSEILDESNDAYNLIKETKNYKWSILKRFTRWLNTLVIR